MKNRVLSLIVISFLVLTACKDKKADKVDQATSSVTPEEVKAIAKDAYVTLFPLVFNYGTMYAQAINKDAPEFVGGFGTFRSYGLASPKNKDIPTPNNNTPYSWAWVDLRTEPWVLTMPPSDGNRYYTSQWDDMWGYVVDSPGSVRDGQEGGKYLITTVDYDGEVPEGITRAIKGETYFMGSLTRTAVNGEKDVPNMMKIQEGYELQPLSEYLEKEAPKKAPAIDWPTYKKEDLQDLRFFELANFMLEYTIPNSEDDKVLDKAAELGMGKGLTWDPSSMSEETKAAVKEGMKEGYDAIQKQVANTKNAKKLFNTREEIGTDYINRATGLVIGQFGNYPDQAIYPAYQTDSEGNPLDGSKHNYTVTFPADKIPEANYFWSFTMYDLPGRFLVENPIDRYSIGSQTPSLKKEKDGSLIIYFQPESPGKAKEGNWLPTPKAPFFTVLRIYGPSKSLVNSDQEMPAMIATDKE